MASASASSALTSRKGQMTDQERIKQLRQALVAARYEIVWWAGWTAHAKWRDRLLAKNLAKYDAVIDAEMREAA